MQRSKERSFWVRENLLAFDEARMTPIRWWAKAAMVFQNGAANLNPVHRLKDQVAEPLIQRGTPEKTGTGNGPNSG